MDWITWTDDKGEWIYNLNTGILYRRDAQAIVCFLEGLSGNGSIYQGSSLVPLSAAFDRIKRECEGEGEVRQPDFYFVQPFCGKWQVHHTKMEMVFGEFDNAEAAILRRDQLNAKAAKPGPSVVVTVAEIDEILAGQRVGLSAHDAHMALVIFLQSLRNRAR
jgi:hypothetical protein